MTQSVVSWEELWARTPRGFGFGDGPQCPKKPWAHLCRGVRVSCEPELGRGGNRRNQEKEAL